jgi:hypothetical protein
MRMIGGAKEQFGDPSAKDVEVCEMEGVNGPKTERHLCPGYLLSGLGCGSTTLLVPFLTYTSPHRAGIVEVFEDTKVPSNARPSKFDSAINRKREKLINSKTNRT